MRISSLWGSWSGDGRRLGAGGRPARADRRPSTSRGGACGSRSAPTTSSGSLSRRRMRSSRGVADGGAETLHGACVEADEGRGKATIATAKLRVNVDLTTGAISFADAAGRPLAAERPGGRSMIRPPSWAKPPSRAPAVGAERRRVALRPGQHQQGLLDIKGYDLELRQYNSEIFIPLLVSSRGYGFLWDNTSLSRFGGPSRRASARSSRGRPTGAGRLDARR